MIRHFMLDSLYEDEGRGDLFASVFKNVKAQARIISKDNGVLAGVKYVKELCRAKGIKCKFALKDGQKIAKGDVIATLKAGSHTLLTCERTLLNTLQHASGIATNTARYVDKVKDYDVKLLDTRKTRPNLRSFEKYAVRCGGGVNHRMGLDDCLMLKDTHLKTIKDLPKFMKQARKKIPFSSKIEIECESLEQVKGAFDVGADIVMCDNMSIDMIEEVVALRNSSYPHILLEASGNVTLDTVEALAQSGVDAISSGSLIHQATWLDFSMRMG
jgi:nicotinate-nucleotide pyrophosphorylase (carboxylating)